jgi:CelD/BcsL family acetyltransferase involved in cellulose biosynthesis
MLELPEPVARDSVEECVGGAAMAAIAAEWDALYRRCPTATPFAHPAWQLAWARHLATGTTTALTLRRDGRLVALLPVHRRPDGVVELMGAPISDYRDVLVDAALGRDAAALLVAAALRAADTVRCELEDLPASSPLVDAPPPPGWRAALSRCAVCPTVMLPVGASIADVASPRLAEDLERFRRRAARRGRLAVRTAGAADCDWFVERLIELHTARWQSRGEGGVLADARVQRFHRQAARDFAAAGLLELSALTLDDEPVALLYAFSDRGRFYFYLSAFHPSLARLSPGTLAIGAALERALATGTRELHFLRGREPYKYRWGGRDRLTLRRTLVREAA